MTDTEPTLTDGERLRFVNLLETIEAWHANNNGEFIEGWLYVGQLLGGANRLLATITKLMAERDEVRSAFADACVRERAHLSAIDAANAGRVEWFARAESAEAENKRLKEAAQAVLDNKFSDITVRGKQVGIESDDGEKCWAVHSDYISALKSALGQGKGT